MLILLFFWEGNEVSLAVATREIMKGWGFSSLVVQVWVIQRVSRKEDDVFIHLFVN